MRRNTVAALTTVSSLALLLAYPTSHNATVASTSGTTAAGTASAAGGASSSSSKSASKSASSGGSNSAAKTYNGDAAQTRWGTVQVQITVQNGKITAVDVPQYPNGNGHDQEINSYALPILTAETITAQSASIDSVGGATVTSGGYISSLQSAINAAHL